MIKLYLCGKITDTSRELEKANLRKFFEVENELRDRGFDVCNPAKFETDGKPWEWYLAHDLKFIYENRPMIYLMEGWRESRGARLEVEFAKLCGLQIISSL